MDFWKSVIGLVVVEITSADMAGLIKYLSDAGVELYDLHDGNDLSMTAKVNRHALKTIDYIVKKQNGEWKIAGRTGIYWKLRRILLRPVVMTSLVLLMLTVFYLPGRIFFVIVEGNDVVPTNRILEAAQQCGIGFGTTRAELRSEKLKNRLLAEIPQIKWVGINTQGCTAIISVREGLLEEKSAGNNSIRSIVAVCDGVIEQCTVIRGNSLCSPGMAVKTGQVLVSAYTDCGIVITAEKADAEIFGRTKRNVDVVTPAQISHRGKEKITKTQYSLILGKKQIKFYKGSGISGAECVKMKEIKHLLLPGGFKLPVALICEREIVYEPGYEAQVDAQWLTTYAETYLRSVMVSGRILNSTVVQSCATDVINHKGSYECYEIIGIPRYEEITG